MGNAAAGAARGDVTTAGSAWPQIGLGIATFLWAGNFIAGRALRGDIGPIELNVWRWAIALAVLLPFTVGALWRQRAILRQHAGLVLGLGVTGVAVPHACVYAALRATTAVNALLLMSLTPLLILVGSRFLYRQSIHTHQWLAMGISLAGAVFLVVRGDIQALLALHASIGDLWMVPAILAAAAQALLLKRSPAGVAQSTLLSASIVAALGLMLPIALIFGKLALPSSVSSIAGVAYIGIMASAVGFVLWNRGVAHTGPSNAAPYLYLMPVYGAALSFLILGEPVHFYQLVGGALVLGGLLLARERRVGLIPNGIRSQ